VECKGNQPLFLNQMFFHFYFRKIIWQNPLKLNTTLSFRQSFKNYPSLERSAKISALIPPFQIFFKL